jgi:secretion/DNA translocation related TadE-like protein
VSRARLLDDDGSGSILAVAVIGSMLCLVALLAPLYIGLSAKSRAAGAADAAALAAADVAVGIAPGSPCAAASSVADANGARLAACSVDGVIVTVRVTVPIIGFSVPGAATAGPPGAVTN